MKAKKTFEILWDESGGKELKNLLKEIQVKSEPLSKKIKNGILEKLLQESKFPLSFEKDQLKVRNSGNHRKIHEIHIRIAYKIDNRKKVIKIIRVKHSSSEPIKY